ncbi:MAG: glycosyltransferase family 2 protein [Candidatus Aenigmatarchaeota archaeon]
MISIIVPAYNEEKGIRKTVERVKKVRFPEKAEIIVVDDGSADNTYGEAKKIRKIRIIRHKKNMGKAAALKTGFNAAKGDVVATIDADCTYPPEDIPEMLKLVRSGEDMILGSRFFNRKRGLNTIAGAAYRALASLAGMRSSDYSNFYGNAFFSSLISALAGKKITDGSTGLRVFRKKILDKIRIKSSGLDWEVEMTTRVLRAGYNVREIPIEYYPRVGKTKLRPIKDGIRFLVGIMRGRFA